MGTPSDSTRLSIHRTLSSPLDVPVSSFGDPRLLSFLMMELLELELVMVGRDAK